MVLVQVITFPLVKVLDIYIITNLEAIVLSFSQPSFVFFSCLFFLSIHSFLFIITTIFSIFHLLEPIIIQPPIGYFKPIINHKIFRIVSLVITFTLTDSVRIIIPNTTWAHGFGSKYGPRIIFQQPSPLITLYGQHWADSRGQEWFSRPVLARND